VVSFFILIKNFIHGIRVVFQDRQFKGLLFLVGLILAVGAVFYAHFEHWSLINSLYFCVITLTTVGYGDFTPQTTTGKIFTIFYVAIGIGIILGFVNIIARHATKRYLQQSDTYLEHSEKLIEQIIEKTIEIQQKRRK
jgi:voltage-gated potassium channel Kch